MKLKSGWHRRLRNGWVKDGYQGVFAVRGNDMTRDGKRETRGARGGETRKGKAT